MESHLLEVLIPAMISAVLLWQGVQCRTREYSLEVPSQVAVQDGLCIHIPCKFTYPASHDDQHAPLYGYWYAEDKQSRRPRLVATNNPERIQEIDPRFRRRFEVSEPKLNSGNCSLTINDAEAADQAIYHFQMEKGHRHWSYTAAKEKVSVIVTVYISAMTHMAQPNKDSFMPDPAPITNEFNTPDAEGSIILLGGWGGRNCGSGSSDKVKDHRKNVTSGITYGEGSSRQSIEKTVTLNIHYPPRILPFSGYKQDRRGDLRTFSNVSDGQIIAWMHESLLVHCVADANPPSSQAWVRTPRHSNRVHISNNELKISGLRMEDRGEYQCQARNKEGSISASFNLQVHDIPHFNNKPRP